MTENSASVLSLMEGVVSVLVAERPVNQPSVCKWFNDVMLIILCLDLFI